MAGEINGKWLEVFRAGDYGEKGNFSREDLDQIVANYDAKIHQAPIVVGHPQADSPAYGWIAGLRRNGDMLEAQADQVDGGFEDLLKQGRFKMRSVALYSDLGGRGLYLRHLGFLGAQPPEVKGLKSVFHDADAKGFVEIEEDEMEIGDIKKAFSEVLEAMGIGKKKEEPAGKTFSEADLTKAATDAAAAERTKVEAQFAERQKIETAKVARQTDIREFTEALSKKGKWIPAFEKAGLVAFMESLAGEASIEFGEGDKKQKKSPYDVFKSFLDGLPKSIEFGELAGGKKPENAPSKYQFNEVSGIAVDQHSVKLLERTNALMKENSKFTFEEAAGQARKELGDKSAVV